jgi:uncharacterized protein YkuJ
MKKITTRYMYMSIKLEMEKNIVEVCDVRKAKDNQSFELFKIQIKNLL